MNFLTKLFLPITAPIRFIQRNFKTVLFLTLIIYIANNTDPKTLQKPNLQIIELNGPIMIVDDILETIEKAKIDPLIKGVLFKVNSPGGAVAPSVELAYAIKELNQIKPVVAYASGIMASGSYYASIYATKIIANAGSIVGSIGVIMQSANLQKLLDTIGIKPQTVKQGLYKEAGTPTREWTAEERGELEQLTLDTYNLFVSDVAEARGLDINNSKSFADAHIFSSKRALKVGLIDKIGVKSDAKKELLKLSKVDKPIWKKKDKFDTFMERFEGKAFTHIKGSFYGLKSEIF
jgi:protease-4